MRRPQGGVGLACFWLFLGLGRMVVGGFWLLGCGNSLGLSGCFFLVSGSWDLGLRYRVKAFESAPWFFWHFQLVASPLNPNCMSLLLVRVLYQLNVTTLPQLRSAAV